MPKVTVSVPDELLAKYKETFPEVNVAAVVRRAISKKVKELKKLEELKSCGVWDSPKFDEFLRKLKSKGGV